MIAKITRGKNPGDIGAYLHGPGHANEHEYLFGRSKRSGGIVIGSNIGMEGHTDPGKWAGELRKAMYTRPEIKNPVWHASLRNTAQDRTLSDAMWADMGQSFAEDLGFDGHPWVMVRHGADHVHIVVSRVSDLGEVWHARNDRRAAQSACTKLELEYGLVEAPRRRVQPKLAVSAERDEFKEKAEALDSRRGELEKLKIRMQKLQGQSFPSVPSRGGSAETVEPTRLPITRGSKRGQDQGQER